MRIMPLGAFRIFVAACFGASPIAAFGARGGTGARLHQGRRQRRRRRVQGSRARRARRQAGRRLRLRRPGRRTADQKNRLAADQQQWLAMREACKQGDRSQWLRQGTLHEKGSRICRRSSSWWHRGAHSASPATTRRAARWSRSISRPIRRRPDSRSMGRTVTAFVARSGSGARYEGPSVSYWEHQGEASVVWFGRTMQMFDADLAHRTAPRDRMTGRDRKQYVILAKAGNHLDDVEAPVRPRPAGSSTRASRAMPTPICRSDSAV